MCKLEPFISPNHKFSHQSFDVWRLQLLDVGLERYHTLPHIRRADTLGSHSFGIVFFKPFTTHHHLQLGDVGLARVLDNATHLSNIMECARPAVLLFFPSGSPLCPPLTACIP